jgi:hypothetical protein
LTRHTDEKLILLDAYLREIGLLLDGVLSSQYRLHRTTESTDLRAYNGGTWFQPFPMSSTNSNAAAMVQHAAGLNELKSMMGDGTGAGGDGYGDQNGQMNSGSANPHDDSIGTHPIRDVVAPNYGDIDDHMFLLAMLRALVMKRKIQLTKSFNAINYALSKIWSQRRQSLQFYRDLAHISSRFPCSCPHYNDAGLYEKAQPDQLKLFGERETGDWTRPARNAAQPILQPLSSLLLWFRPYRLFISFPHYWQVDDVQDAVQFDRGWWWFPDKWVVHFGCRTSSPRHPSRLPSVPAAILSTCQKFINAAPLNRPLPRARDPFLKPRRCCRRKFCESLSQSQAFHPQGR